MKLKRIIALSLSAATLALSLTACGGSSSAASDNAQASDSNSGDAVTVKLGVVGSIYETYFQISPLIYIYTLL